jgi:hypothetical protein
MRLGIVVDPGPELKIVPYLSCENPTHAKLTNDYRDTRLKTLRVQFVNHGTLIAEKVYLLSQIRTFFSFSDLRAESARLSVPAIHHCGILLQAFAH